MAGMDGFVHTCETDRSEKKRYKSSLFESSFSQEEQAIIWDFYVTRSISGASSQSFSVTDFGWKTTQSKTNGYPAIEEKMATIASFDNGFCMIRSSTIKDTLKAMDLSGENICVEHPRAVLKQNYKISCDENEKMQFDSSATESRFVCLFRHIRNAFAHGNTYFFENGSILLEDYEGKNTITCSMVIKHEVLMEWIYAIDFSEKYYKRNG